MNATWQTKASSRMLRSEEHTSELQSRLHLVCRLLLEKKKTSCHGSRAPRPHGLPRAATRHAPTRAPGVGGGMLAGSRPTGGLRHLSAVCTEARLLRYA